MSVVSGPNLYLCTFFANNTVFGGGAIVREMLELLHSRFTLNWFYSDEFVEPNPVDDWVKRAVHGEPFHVMGRRKYLNTLIDYYLFYVVMPRHARRLARRLKPDDVVWIVLENKMIPFAYELVKRFSGKVHLSVHDDCRDFYDGYRFIGREKTHEYLKTIFSKAISADMISKQLAGEYARQFGTSARVYRRGIDHSAIRVRKPVVSGRYTLLFAGSSHSNKCWNQLLDRLETFSGEFEIHVYGKAGFAEHLPQKKNVKFILKGIVNEAELMRGAAECDFAIFFFDDLKPSLLEFSISTKLTAYGRAGLPLLGIISPRSELIELFTCGCAFDVLTGDERVFHNWIRNFSEKDYLDYFDRNFNAARMREGLLDCKAFI
jgi:hypothetical protein